MSCLVLLLQLTTLSCSLATNQGTTNPGNQHILQVLHDSAKLQKLLHQATIGFEHEIRFDVLRQDQQTAYQGLTTFFANNTDDILVQIPSVATREKTENLLAHELGHIILGKQGFPVQAAIVNGHFIEKTPRGQLLSATAVILVSCYADAEIDRLLPHYGFNPIITNRMKREALDEQARIGTLDAVGHDPLWRKHLALDLFCLSLRTRDFDISEVASPLQRLDPTLLQDIQSLTTSLKGAQCSTGQSCVKLTKRLRAAAGFEPYIQIGNPATKQFE